MKDRYREANLREAVYLASCGSAVVVYCQNPQRMVEDFDWVLRFLEPEPTGFSESGNLLIDHTSGGWLDFCLPDQRICANATHVVSVGQQGVQALMFTPTESDHPDGAE